MRDHSQQLKRPCRPLEAANIGNLVGEVVVSAAVERGLVDPDAIIRIDGVPHAQILKL